MVGSSNGSTSLATLSPHRSPRGGWRLSRPPCHAGRRRPVHSLVSVRCGALPKPSRISFSEKSPLITDFAFYLLDEQWGVTAFSFIGHFIFLSWKLLVCFVLVRSSLLVCSLFSPPPGFHVLSIFFSQRVSSLSSHFSSNTCIFFYEFGDSYLIPKVIENFPP